MSSGESLSLSQLESLIFIEPRSPYNIAQKLHNPANFSLQKQLWDIVLDGSKSTIAERVNQLLPEEAITDESIARLYQTYDCVAFALYVLGPDFVEGTSQYRQHGVTVIQPKVKSLGWREIPWWTTDGLKQFGFSKTITPSGNIPTLTIFTLEDENFVYSQPVHFAIYLGAFDGQQYVAQKANVEYLPEILPLEQVINTYRGEPNSLNEVPGVEFWELSR